MIRAISFLQRQSKSGVLYFRRRIPERYRHAFNGKSEIKLSLKTCEKAIAAPRAMLLYAEVQSCFNKIDEVACMVKGNNFGKIDFKETVFPDGRIERKTDIDYEGDSEKELAALKQLQNIIADSGQNAAKPKSNQLVNIQNDTYVDSEKLSVVCSKYREEMKRESRWTSKTASEHESSHDLLIQYFRNAQIVTITPTKARLFREVLFQMPPNMTKGK